MLSRCHTCANACTRTQAAHAADDAVRSGARIAVCSTSNEKAVQTIVDVLLGNDISRIMHVYAGDMVPKKKPDPAVYELAATAFGVDPARCVGCLAGCLASLPVVLPCVSERCLGVGA